MKSAPTTIWVAWCDRCGNPIIAERRAFDGWRTSCPTCPFGVGCVKVARYQLAKSAKRSGRKPRKCWKREKLTARLSRTTKGIA